ncbi:MAG: IS630 family transposase [Candidatus Rokubacteria bacterium]|nr:IS630 family transposase [Candidatus Rokubacteria bacterium]
MTALACTLPRQSKKPLSRWSSTELAQVAKAQGIVKSISPSTIKSWLRAEQIKPWQYHSWQKPTDPRFLEKAIPVLDLYAQAQSLAQRGHIVVCADEKTSLQARKTQGALSPARPGLPLRVGDRYQRKGALQLFAALLVSTGETIARCFKRKRFVEFQAFLQTIFGSLWCKRIRCLHLILDNGSTHAPKQIEAWIRTLQLPFQVKLHWLPVHASWLDQIEIVFSQIQRKVLTPNHFESLRDLEHVLMNHFRERNKHPKPIRWSYTSAKLQKKFAATSALGPAVCV